MSSDLVTEDDLGSYLSTVLVVVNPISTLLVMYFIYGIYVLLFGTYLHMIWAHKQSLYETPANVSLYFRLTIILFALSTFYFVVYNIQKVGSTVIFFDAARRRRYHSLFEYMLYKVEVLYSLESIISNLVNITADWMLVHRCYTIWSFNRRIGVPLILASVIVNATGFVSAIMLSISMHIGSEQLWALTNLTGIIYTVTSTGINLILTILTAGRIWWIHRQVRALDVQVISSNQLVESICRIILESGILYPLFQIANLIVANIPNITTVPFDFSPIVVLSAGLAPTLIMVRAKFGKNVESLQTGQGL